MKLTKDKLPLYHQLENILRKRILKGELSPGAPFPTDYQLCEEYGVSRITVRQALKILETDGLIKREQGRGTFVEHNPMRTFFYEVSGSLEKVFDFREAGTISLTAKIRIKAAEQIAFDLGVDNGEDIFLFEGRQELSEDHQQAQYLEVYTTKEIGEKISLKGEKRSQFYLVLEKASLETAVQFNQIIYATTASKSMASAIDIPEGTALLVIKHIFISKNKTVLGVVIRYSPGDAYQIIHKMKLKKT